MLVSLIALELKLCAEIYYGEELGGKAHFSLSEVFRGPALSACLDYSGSSGSDFYAVEEGVSQAHRTNLESGLPCPAEVSQWAVDLWWME